MTKDIVGLLVHNMIGKSESILLRHNVYIELNYIRGSDPFYMPIRETGTSSQLFINWFARLLNLIVVSTWVYQDSRNQATIQGSPKTIGFASETQVKIGFENWSTIQF